MTSEQIDDQTNLLQKAKTISIDSNGVLSYFFNTENSNLPQIPSQINLLTASDKLITIEVDIVGHIIKTHKYKGDPNPAIGIYPDEMDIKKVLPYNYREELIKLFHKKYGVPKVINTPITSELILEDFNPSLISYDPLNVRWKTGNKEITLSTYYTPVVMFDSRGRNRKVIGKPVKNISSLKLIYQFIPHLRELESEDSKTKIEKTKMQKLKSSKTLEEI